jgi:hypothetical protein
MNQKFWSSEKEGRKFYSALSVKQQFSINGRLVVLEPPGCMTALTQGWMENLVWEVGTISALLCPFAVKTRLFLFYVAF